LKRGGRLLTEQHKETVTIPSIVTEPDELQPPRPPNHSEHFQRRGNRNNNNNPPYSYIHTEPWDDKQSNYSLRNIIINRQRGITYHPRLITPKL
jgi:hypothetical protein